MVEPTEVYLDEYSYIEAEWIFPRDTPDEEAADYVLENTQCMEECGYKMIMEESWECVNSDGEDSFTVVQDWKKEL